ncbi:ribonuclease H [Candidatus Kaiserbacteria bacterium CG10_big_fil_rev_8_21_14_0_10_59_10]|uniref:Ribonuclease H n=1 Tax=Candidatus Kaiserbacteria bacterium CG10_big_fil_rev_8_21_14_0_10_59_10 TaxID=1974612 RepID=A0A2H0U8D0_9BACT|nr:MAG: ribonuclease H [Candidatus Kaiserbacteria bacterium CG10_big_fil_rev_8_21_14_0_10_59_10]
MGGVVIYTDGGARGNPGPAGAGVVAYENGRKIFELKKFLGARQTNNWAEYEALALALSEAKLLGYAGRDIEVRMDSKLVVEQVLGNWKIKEPTLKPQVEKVRALLSDFGACKLTHVSRGENKEADALVNEAIDEAAAGGRE